MKKLHHKPPVCLNKMRETKAGVFHCDTAEAAEAPMMLRGEGLLTYICVRDAGFLPLLSIVRFTAPLSMLELFTGLHDPLLVKCKSTAKSSDKNTDVS